MSFFGCFGTSFSDSFALEPVLEIEGFFAGVTDPEPGRVMEVNHVEFWALSSITTTDCRHATSSFRTDDC